LSWRFLDKQTLMNFFRLLPCLLLFSTSTVLIGQHTERYKNLTHALKAKKPVTFQNFYSDGALKDEGTSLAYKTPEYTYRKTSGTYRTFYKTGELKSVSELDRLGNVMDATFYNVDGSTWWKAKTLKIDSDLRNYKNYFRENDHLKISKSIKEYKYAEEIGGMYLRAEGVIENGSKRGLWKIYDADGRLEEEIYFD